ncbi:MAG TPA: cyanophycin synthetase, partial [Dehalococcoidia bacterium]|nr:cyanophycin synthetase [Dehalococcoidia bacterium]
AGYGTGLFTSPHLHSYRERVRIDGDPISPEGFVRMTKVVKRAVEREGVAMAGRSLVTFDLFTTLAFQAFREADVGVQVLEAGLGGRLDSTNVFETKDVACITPISLEHTQILGDTPELIAREKAAIITPGCTAVMAPQPFAEAAAVIRERARDTGARVVDVSEGYTWRAAPQARRRQDIVIEGPGGRTRARLPLLGAHQVENAATAVACIDAVREHGASVPETAIADGLATVHWPGRLEVLREIPLVIADGAHNRDSARRLREALETTFSAAGITFIVGTSSDKDVAGLAEELAPLAERVLAVRANHPRAMAADDVAKAFRGAAVASEVVDNVGAALERALAEAGNSGVICLTGSLFVAAEAREHLGLGRKERI